MKLLHDYIANEEFFGYNVNVFFLAGTPIYIDSVDNTLDVLKTESHS